MCVYIPVYTGTSGFFSMGLPMDCRGVGGGGSWGVGNAPLVDPGAFLKFFLDSFLFGFWGGGGFFFENFFCSTAPLGQPFGVYCF